MPAAGRLLQRRPAPTVPGGGVGPVSQENLDDRRIPTQGRVVQGRIAVVIPCLDIRPVRQQQRGEVSISARGRIVQWSELARVFGIDIGTMGDEKACRPFIASKARHMQCRVALLVPFVRIGVVVEQKREPLPATVHMVRFGTAGRQEIHLHLLQRLVQKGFLQDQPVTAIRLGREVPHDDLVRPGGNQHLCRLHVATVQRDDQRGRSDIALDIDVRSAGDQPSDDVDVRAVGGIMQWCRA